MNIALVCHVYPPEHAPAGVMVRQIAGDLTAAGHKVTVLTGWPNHPEGVLFPGWASRWRSVEREQGFTVIRCGHSIHPRKRIAWRLWYYLTFAVSTFFNGLAAGPIDTVLCLSTPLFGSWTAWLLARCKGARFVYDIFDLHPESALHAGLLADGRAYRLMRACDTLLCRRSHAIATLSEGLRDSILERGIDPARVSIIPFWIDPEAIRPGDRDNPWRRKHNIHERSFVALYAGTLGYVSGAEILIDVARALRARQDILLLVVGSGVVKDRLEDRARYEGLDNLRFLPFQPERDLPQLQATADVGLVTLLPEAGLTSIPSKVLGYLAAGRPVVAGVAADSDTARMITAGRCGLITPSQDAAAMAQAILTLADDREQALRMGQNGRTLMETAYSRRQCTELYRRILTSR